MDALYGEGSAGGQRGAVVAARTAWERKVQQFLDQSVPHTGPRWGAFAVVVLFYLLRVYLLQGFYIVTYGIAIFNLNLAIGFLSPAFDPEEQEGPTLPTTEKEFKPFVRRVPEFKFWCAARAARASPVPRPREEGLPRFFARCRAGRHARPRDERCRTATRRCARCASRCVAAPPLFRVRRRLTRRHALRRRCAAGSTPSSPSSSASG
jgi:hypothetical protein